MPIYEYHCNKCSHDFEAMQRVGDDLIKICPKCNGDEVKKMMSAPPFHLKGTGWYVTDFKDKDKKNTDEAQANGKDKVSTDKTAEKDSKGKDNKGKSSEGKSTKEKSSKEKV